MPGKASLRAQQYYAHPQNLFWDFMAQFFEFDREAPYSKRISALQQNRVALWDVLKSCTRTSSLDSDIISSSIVINPFGKFFQVHPAITAVCFNGAKADALYRRHVLPDLECVQTLSYHRLPSTSPANASIPRSSKLREWRSALSAV
jgi:TDG/mug DNA glycosylase family protein